MLQAQVPRNLKVRSSVQLAGQRISARVFWFGVSILFCGGLMLIAGFHLSSIVRLGGALFVLGLLVFEVRWWGRSTMEFVRIVLLYVRRSRKVRLEQLMISLPPETQAVVTPARPRWQAPAGQFRE